MRYQMEGHSCCCALLVCQTCYHLAKNLLSSRVVYNCVFFAETGQATKHQSGIILHAVWKIRTLVTAGSFTEWGGALLVWREGRNKKYQSWKTEVYLLEVLQCSSTFSRTDTLPVLATASPLWPQALIRLALELHCRASCQVLSSPVPA